MSSEKDDWASPKEKVALLQHLCCIRSPTQPHTSYTASTAFQQVGSPVRAVMQADVSSTYE